MTSATYTPTNPLMANMPLVYYTVYSQTLPETLETNMTARIISFMSLSTLLCAILLIVPAQYVEAAEPSCQANGEYKYICGMNSPEDLLAVPGGNWVIASGFAGKNSLYLINSKNKAWRNFYPSIEPLARQNMSMYGQCPGSPNPNNFTGHGLNIRKQNDNLSLLYVVGHGEREAIEIFEIDTSHKVPIIAWVGCVMTPDGLAANSVTSLADGTLLATIPLHKNVDINDIFVLESTGSVYSWSPGDAQFTPVEGTQMRYPNGIEVSSDGSEFYVASSGDLKVMTFSNTRPAKLLRSTEPLPFVPDNLRWGKNGLLVSAGMQLNDPKCGNIALGEVLDFMKFATCPRSFMAIATDPLNMQTSLMAQSVAQQQFSNVTMALEINNELWFGSFGGDRIAYIEFAER